MSVVHGRRQPKKPRRVDAASLVRPAKPTTVSGKLQIKIRVEQHEERSGDNHYHQSRRERIAPMQGDQANCCQYYEGREVLG